jgi:hypothetical protein
LGIDFICESVVFVPELITASDETEDGMRVDVVGEGKALLQKYRLKILDMSPRGFVADEGSVEDKTAVIIQRCDERPFFFGGGSPEMDRR